MTDAFERPTDAGADAGAAAASSATSAADEVFTPADLVSAGDALAPDLAADPAPDRGVDDGPDGATAAAQSEPAAVETAVVDTPTINLADPDPEAAGMDLTPNVAAARPVKAVLSNSFGFGGQNTALILTGPGR
ncbi:MAG TPA: hypothetical protein VK697_11815 [Methylomirabilota bacterium]|nr:hypothetical protein [Methylomirabilota bacterium]